jgi:hypothetical protein
MNLSEFLANPKEASCKTDCRFLCMQLHTMFTSMAERKTVPLSVRVSDDDAAFLASLEIAGAATPSEKLRAILAQARLRAEGVEDEIEAAQNFKDFLRPAERRVRQAEARAGLRSDLARKLHDRLPDLMASLAGGVSGRAGKAELAQFEDRLSIQAFALAEELLELGLASENRVYDPERLKRRMAPAVAILERLKLARAEAQGERNE